MNRRRLVYGCVLFALIAGVVGAWYFLTQRDADFVIVGPKTIGVRGNFDKLNRMIDPADFRDCKTVRDAINRLNETLRKDDPALVFDWPERGLRGWLRVDEGAFVARQFKNSKLASPFELSADARPISLKQFLRMTFAQSGVPDVNFVVRGHYVEATSAHQAHAERARYLDGVSLANRVHTLWKEMTGQIEPDPPEFDLWITY